MKKRVVVLLQEFLVQSFQTCLTIAILFILIPLVLTTPGVMVGDLGVALSYVWIVQCVIQLGSILGLLAIALLFHGLSLIIIFWFFQLRRIDFRGLNLSVFSLLGFCIIKEFVAGIWNSTKVSSCPMYSLIDKLKVLKRHIKDGNHNVFGGVNQKVFEAKESISSMPEIAKRPSLLPLGNWLAMRRKVAQCMVLISTRHLHDSLHRFKESRIIRFLLPRYKEV